MSGTNTLLKFDDDSLQVKVTQDVEDIIENNKRLQTTPQKSDWGRHIASVPNVFINKMMDDAYARGNVNMKMFDEEFNRFYEHNIRNNPEWRAFRTDNPSNPFHLGWRAK